MLPCLVPVLFAFYLQDVLKFKCKIPAQKVKENISGRQLRQNGKWKLYDVSGTVPENSDKLNILKRLSTRNISIETCRLESFKTYTVRTIVPLSAMISYSAGSKRNPTSEDVHCWLLAIYIHIYRVSHELWSLIRESVPYVKIYRYNPKHLCPKLNG